MSIIEYTSKHVVAAQGSDTVFNAAKRMRHMNVGSVVVIDPHKKPIGMVTDRDIAVKVIAEGKDPQATLLSTIMTEDIVSLSQDQGVFEATKLMSEKGIRRLPVIDAQGKLAGIICLDDFIMILGVEVANIAAAIAYGSNRPAKRKIPTIDMFTSDWELPIH